ncbi:hypothetical protein RRG08_020696 [Elysia crispata]|uniref:Uncharacterized protein n=1 Tax=Elysia crispata TaxID=231223 RepID=A0AAE0ZLD7_9GAST|nr:hypothetical protein RRG08_020696 [Elysia crispata]
MVDGGERNAEGDGTERARETKEIVQQMGTTSYRDKWEQTLLSCLVAVCLHIIDPCMTCALASSTDQKSQNRGSPDGNNTT